MQLVPLEEFVFEGFSARFKQTFGTIIAITNEHEKRRTIDRLKNGEQMSYPYAFAKITGTDSTQNSYNPQQFVRRGIETVVAQDKNNVYTVRCMPISFEMDLEYHTNAFLGPDSVMLFVKRWNMAARGGYLKFTINYGRLKLGVGVTMQPSTSIPEKENAAEQENVYIVQTQCTIHGWVSEQKLGSKGLIKRLDTELGVFGSLEAAGIEELQPEVNDYLQNNPSAKFMPFTSTNSEASSPAKADWVEIARSLKP